MAGPAAKLKTRSWAEAEAGGATAVAEYEHVIEMGLVARVIGKAWMAGVMEVEVFKMLGFFKSRV